MEQTEIEKLAGEFAIAIHHLYGTGDALRAQIVYLMALDTLRTVLEKTRHIE